MEIYLSAPRQASFSSNRQSWNGSGGEEEAAGSLQPGLCREFCGVQNVMKSFAGPLSTWPCLGCLGDRHAYSTVRHIHHNELFISLRCQCESWGGRTSAGEWWKWDYAFIQTLTMMMGAERWNSTLQSWEHFLVLQHLCRHTVRSMSRVCAHTVAKIHTKNRVRDFERWEKWRWERDGREQ